MNMLLGRYYRRYRAGELCGGRNRLGVLGSGRDGGGEWRDLGRRLARGVVGVRRGRMGRLGFLRLDLFVLMGSHGQTELRVRKVKTTMMTTMMETKKKNGKEYPHNLH